MGGGRGIDGAGVIWKDGGNYQAVCVYVCVGGLCVEHSTKIKGLGVKRSTLVASPV